MAVKSLPKELCPHQRAEHLIKTGLGKCPRAGGSTVRGSQPKRLYAVCPSAGPLPLVGHDLRSGAHEKDGVWAAGPSTIVVPRHLEL